MDSINFANFISWLQLLKLFRWTKRLRHSHCNCLISEVGVGTFAQERIILSLRQALSCGNHNLKGKAMHCARTFVNDAFGTFHATKSPLQDFLIMFQHFQTFILFSLVYFSFTDKSQ